MSEVHDGGRVEPPAAATPSRRGAPRTSPSGMGRGRHVRARRRPRRRSRSAVTRRSSRPSRRAPPTPLRRCGAALPTVSAAIMTPIAVPRPTRNHVETSLRAGGYTPARNAPVSSRSTTAASYRSIGTMAALASAASTAATRIRRPRGHPVGEPDDRRSDGAHHETELQHHDQQRRRVRREIPSVAELGENRRRAEPGRHREHQTEREHGECTTLVAGVGVAHRLGEPGASSSSFRRQRKRRAHHASAHECGVTDTWGIRGDRGEFPTRRRRDHSMSVST